MCTASRSLLSTNVPALAEKNYKEMLVSIRQARHDLRLRIIGPKNVAVDRSMTFEYFDEVRKIVEEERKTFFSSIAIWMLTLFRSICRTFQTVFQSDCFPVTTSKP